MKKLLVSACVAFLATQWIPISVRAQSIPNPVPLAGSVVDTISMNPTATLTGTGYDLFGASTNGGYDYAFGFAFKVASASQIVAVEFLVSQRDPGVSASALLYKGRMLTGSSDLYYWTPQYNQPPIATFNLVSALPAPNDTAFYVLRFEASVPLGLEPNTPYVFVFDPVPTPAGTGTYALAHIDQSDGFLSAIGQPGIDVFMPPYLVRRMTDIRKSYLYNTWTFTRIDRRYLVRLISSVQAPTPKPGTIAFTSASFGANENATFVRLTVSRAGGSDGAASVSYATSDGSAKAGQDYTAASGTLNWASGDAQDKYIDVPLLNDSVYEGNEQFSVVLSNVSGASLGTPATAQVTIVEDDQPAPGTIAFTSASFGAGENAAFVRLTVSRTGGSAGAASVSYGTVDGSAKAGQDYTAASGTLNWASGEAQDKYIDVPLLNDSVYEGNEQFSVVLSNVSGASLGTPATAQVTIVEDDQPASGTIAFASASFGAGENAAFVRLTVSRTGGSASAASVSYGTVDGSAKAGQDYTAASGTLNWASGDAQDKYIDVPLLNDSVYEGNEQFSVVLSNVSGASLGTPATAQVTIVEDDQLAPGTIAFVSATYNADENGTKVQLVVSRTGGSDGAASVSYATVDGSAKAGEDYTATSGTLNWASGDAQDKYIEVPLLNDSVYEGNEQFSVVLSNASGASLGTPATAQVTIVEDDQLAPGTIAFVSATYNADENGTKVQLVVSRTGGSDGAASVSYATVDGSAKAGLDYTAASGTLNWASGDAQDKYIEVPLLNDSVYEGNEQFSVVLSDVSGASLGSPATAQVTIVDDDQPARGTIAFASATYNVNENGTTVQLVVSRAGGSDGEASVSYGTADGSAKAGQDYTTASGTLNWADGDAQDKVIEISIENDAFYEGDEGFSVVLSDASGASLGSPATAQVTIVDDDLNSVPVITVEASMAIAGEPNSGYNAGIFIVKRSGLLTGDVVVRFKLGGTARYGTAANGGDWYLYPSSVTNGLTLKSGTTSAKVVVYISNDSVAEPDETVIMTIEPSSDYAVGEPASATITIKDDEMPVVSVTATDPVAGESETGEGNGEFTFTRLGSTKDELTVAFALGGTAVEAQDFAPVGSVVVLPAGASSATVSVSPIDDSVWEEDKTLVLTLQAGAGYTVGSPETATVLIKNDDPLILSTVTVTAVDSTADENGGKGVFVFGRTEAIDSELTVHIEVAGTATPDTDYAALDNTVTFPAGVSEIVKVVEPINNEIVDGDRTVVVTLKPDASYNVASPDSATVTIMDDDVPIVTVWAVDDTASEYGPGAAVFRFGRAGSLVDPLTVHFSVTGTATAGEDYADIGQSVTFPAGANTVSVAVTPIDDGEVEGEETITITITFLEGDIYDERFASPATVRILDNDVAVGFGDGGLHSAPATAGRAGLAGTSQVDSSESVNGNTVPGSLTGQNGADLLSLGLLSAPIVQVQAGYLVLTYERVTPNPGFEYLIEVSPDLINWAPAGSKIREIVTQPGEGREVVQAYYLEPLTGGEARFLRLRVVASEQRASW